MSGEHKILAVLLSLLEHAVCSKFQVETFTASINYLDALPKRICY